MGCKNSKIVKVHNRGFDLIDGDGDHNEVGPGDGGDDDGREHSNAFMKRRRRSIKITRIAIPSLPSWDIRKVRLGGGRLVIPLPAVRQEIRLLVRGGSGVDAPL